MPNPIAAQESSIPPCTNGWKLLRTNLGPITVFVEYQISSDEDGEYADLNLCWFNERDAVQCDEHVDQDAPFNSILIARWKAEAVSDHQEGERIAAFQEPASASIRRIASYFDRVDAAQRCLQRAA